MKLIYIIFTGIVICGFAYMIIINTNLNINGFAIEDKNHSEPVNVPIYNDFNVDFNITKVQEEVILEMQSYFDGVDFGGFTTNHISNEGWWKSQYDDSDYTISIGILGLDKSKDIYKFVFTHEYIHYILHKEGISNRITQESIADVYTRFTNLEEQKDILGENNEGRTGKYAIISNKIIKEDNWDCLNKVFDEKHKIKKFKDIPKRLSNYCNITQKYLEEQGAL